jgi:hypothetical protein|tara:strand:- start:145 stop:546 length:402 start_codon:yes stop_codon:yes gene_type:complete
MRILTVLILLLLAPVTMAGMTASLAQAQESKKPEGDALTIFTRAPCDMFPKMVDTIKKYKEELLFVGDGMTFSAKTGQPHNGGMMFFVNQDTGTWSMLQLFADGMSCMIMNGKRFEPYTGPSPYGNDTPEYTE